MSSLDSSSKGFERLFSEFDSLTAKETSDKSSGLKALDVTDGSADKIALAASKGMDLKVTIGNKIYIVKQADAESFLRRNAPSIKDKPLGITVDTTAVTNALQDIATLLEVKTALKNMMSKPDNKHPMSKENLDRMIYLLTPTVDKKDAQRFLDSFGPPKDGMLLIEGNRLMNFLKTHEKAVRMHPQLKDEEEKLGKLLAKIKLPFKQIASTSISKKGWANEAGKIAEPAKKKAHIKTKEILDKVSESEIGPKRADKKPPFKELGSTTFE